MGEPFGVDMFGNSPFERNFDFFGSVFPVIFTLMFILFFGFFIFAIIRGIGQWSWNNSQPILSVAAVVVSRRTDISTHHHHHADHDGIAHNNHHTTTNYYVTFEVESGSRMEFEVTGQEYGMLMEGDTGKLTFQGTRYKGFARGAEQTL